MPAETRPTWVKSPVKVETHPGSVELGKYLVHVFVCYIWLGKTLVKNDLALSLFFFKRIAPDTARYNSKQ